jgi:hypothetical protein
VTAGDIAVGSNGVASIVFTESKDTESAVSPYGVRRGPSDATWSSPALIQSPDAGSTASNVSLEAGSDGSARGVFATPDLRGLAWDIGGAPAATANPGVPAITRAAVASDASGRAYAVAEASGKIFFAEFTAAGWGPAEELAAQGTTPSIDASPSGDVAIAYIKGSGTTAQVVLRRRRAGESAFSDEAAGTLTQNGVARPSVGIDPNRIITVAFVLVGSSPLAPNRIQAVRWVDDAPSPGSVVEISGNAPERGAADFPQLVVDPAGRVAVLWTQQPPPSGTNLMASERISGTFSSPQVVSAVGSPSFEVAVDEQGTAAAIFIEGTGSTSSVSAARRATGGLFKDKTRLSTEGVPKCPAGGCVKPRVAAVAAGQADTFFILTVGSGSTAVDRGYAARFRGAPPAGGPVVAEAEGCPVGINKISGDDGDNVLGGTPANDGIFGRGGNDRIGASGGNDCVRGGTGNDDAGGDTGNDELHGEDGNDSLRGDQGNDAILGGEGDDIVSGGDGDDGVLGEGGADRVLGGLGNDSIEGGPGADRLFAGEGSDVAAGGENNDLLSGSRGNDRLSGDDGDDKLNDSSGRNRLDGGAGNDRLRGGTGRDTLIGGAGRDLLYGLGGNDLLTGGGSTDVARGGAGNDRISGGSGADRLRGGSGADVVSGGAGNDRLWGDAGKDRIGGGAGRDSIHSAGGGADAVNCGKGNDLVIADRSDRIAGNCERVRYRRS